MWNAGGDIAQHRRIERARRDRDDADIVLRIFKRELPRHRENAALGRGISGRALLRLQACTLAVLMMTPRPCALIIGTQRFTIQK